MTGKGKNVDDLMNPSGDSQWNSSSSSDTEKFEESKQIEVKNYRAKGKGLEDSPSNYLRKLEEINKEEEVPRPAANAPQFNLKQMDDSSSSAISATESDESMRIPIQHTPLDPVKQGQRWAQEQPVILSPDVNTTKANPGMSPLVPAKKGQQNVPGSMKKPQQTLAQNQKQRELPKVSKFVSKPSQPQKKVEEEKKEEKKKGDDIAVNENDFFSQGSESESQASAHNKNPQKKEDDSLDDESSYDSEDDSGSSDRTDNLRA